MIITTTMSALVLSLATTGAIPSVVAPSKVAVSVPLIYIPEVPAESSQGEKVRTEVQQFYVSANTEEGGVVRTLNDEQRPVYGRA
jgi:hypothetical protein